MKTLYQLLKKSNDQGVYEEVDRRESRAAAAYVTPVPDLDLWQVSGDPENRHVDTVDASWLICPMQVPENDADAIQLALKVALEYGQIDGDHHKAWVIDQIVRVLTGNAYASVIEEYRDGEDGPETYSWDEGIAP